MNESVPHNKLEIGQKYWLISNIIGIIVQHIIIESKPKDGFIRYQIVGEPKNQYAIIEEHVFHDELSAWLKAWEIVSNEQNKIVEKIKKLIGEKI